MNVSEGGALRWIEQLEADKRLEAVKECWAKVAETQEGKIVIAQLLLELHFFTPADTSEQAAWCNFAKHLVRNYFGDHAQFRVIEALTGRSD